MRQSEKIKYMLTTELTEDELKNVIHYSFSNRPIDTKLWLELLDKLDLTDDDITTDFHDKIKNLVYDAFIIKRIDYDDLTLMFCVYVVSNEYKRKISDYERFEPSAKLLATRLMELKGIFDMVENYLIKLTSNLYCTPISQSTYNLIEETNKKIYYYIYDITNCSVTTKLKADIECNKILLSFDYDVKQNYIIKNTGFDFIFELLNYDILYFNTYGYFFNSLYSIK